MPTLHLIDGQSTQACPAVMSVLRAWLARGDEADRLLLLGGRPLEVMARGAGIEKVHRIAPRFGRTRLTTRPIKRWLQTQPGFDHVHAWSLDAMLGTGFVFHDTPMKLSSLHTLNPAELKQLRKFCKSPWPSPVQVVTHSQAWCDQLSACGINAEIEPTLLPAPPEPPAAPPLSDSTRVQGHALESNHRTVALLSDHPSQADAMHAAAIACLAGASLLDDTGQPLGIRLVVHPEQVNRQRAQYFLADQSDTHRVVQDVRAAELWKLLQDCDAALAIGPNAGGLSLHTALNAGIDVITDNPVVADDTPSPPPHLHIARSSAHKDVAHMLHQALMGARAMPAV